MGCPESESDLNRLNKMFLTFTDESMYRNAVMRDTAYLEIYPDDARYLAKLLQELKEYRKKDGK